MENNKMNVSISGSGHFAGGDYDRISISGSGRGQGDVRAREVCVSGSAHMMGVEAERVRVSGSAKFEGEVRAGEMHISGRAHIVRGVDVNRLHVSGSLRAEDGLRGGSAAVSGAAHVDGEMEFEEAVISGAIHVTGLLNADRLTIRLGGKSEVGEIGGTTIRVEKNINAANALISRILNVFGRWDGIRSLTCGTIEGTNVYLENTKAKIVRGQTVVIGPGCHIERVESVEPLSVDETSEVLHQKQIETSQT